MLDLQVNLAGNRAIITSLSSEESMTAAPELGAGTRWRQLLDLDAVMHAERGIRLLRVADRDVWMSWEDVAVVIMGPRANKTSALAVPAVLSAPGLAIATSNKADLWALTSGLRGRAGPVWTFDPQAIAHAPQLWWWDPLRAIREAPDDHRYEAAARALYGR